MPIEHVSADRDIRRAILRGLKGRCPSCNDTSLFARFLKPVPACSTCGQDWSGEQADDFPAYIVILLLGHLIVPLVIEANRKFTLPTGVQMILWPLLAVILALLLIQPAKGAVIGLQWARRMQGFAVKHGG